ncbi:toxin ParE1/3/4 [Rheinheimera pacifica]|uniref:type II toxin-antitoxin system RelE/ParE family toxin n=1 Tax=Rheinheimera pacifica TaxID=173990 RepID=UPI00216AAD75|nr:type II toxin-antitoxin system RelE/ParE family toxin [Rheinheimera pacifica]MCS4307528.1 toxin ParE1/3/4 [Rheinheimera pacifica]
MVQSKQKTYRVTLRVRDDLINIARYTENLWGKKQRDIYLKLLGKRFAWLAENPLLGKHRTDIRQGYYSFPQGQHVIFYLVGQNVIDIIGVLHQQMDVVGYFNAPL